MLAKMATMLQRSLRLSLLILASAFIAIPAHADDVTSYQIEGYFVVVGEDLCSGPCTETVDFSFVESITAASQGQYVDAISDSVFSAYGVLGDFSGAAGPNSIQFGAYMEYFLGPVVESTDELDMYVTNSEAAGPIGYNYALIFNCSSSACVADFDSTPGAVVGPDADVGYGGYGELTATLIPEPSTLGLLLSGVFPLGLLAASRKRLVQTAGQCLASRDAA